ncbi:hypothetical protein CONLIGDRAFT_649003 [Coniochaeta ligniaria NRRL 30616]|uniref:Uncharacterized protein n=1 Tax=Coniochaeta ligniaria NRRL 30616 TaxID=1408157 RepID=A0A1J7J9M9_9PEZI|nr:hypothetical protein CONLIGDRAFT_649003 [Coniochaeta ligniaria NRRL 30616]
MPRIGVKEILQVMEAEMLAAQATISGVFPDVVRYKDRLEHVEEDSYFFAPKVAEVKDCVRGQVHRMLGVRHAINDVLHPSAGAGRIEHGWRSATRSECIHLPDCSRELICEGQGADRMFRGQGGADGCPVIQHRRHTSRMDTPLRNFLPGPLVITPAGPVCESQAVCVPLGHSHEPSVILTSRASGLRRAEERGGDKIDNRLESPTARVWLSN